LAVLISSKNRLVLYNLYSVSTSVISKYFSSSLYMNSKMSTADNSADESRRGEVEKRQFPPVPEGAIVKPEDERPAKMQIRPEEKSEEKEADIEYLDTESEDMDGDGSPDWDPAVGPGT
jgi:hypothetical protein